MAKFKYSRYLAPDADPAFDELYDPGTAAPLTGVYRCEGCGFEVVSRAQQPLPSTDHHQHANKTIDVCWRLIVRVKDRDATI